MVIAVAVSLEGGSVLYQCGGRVHKHGDPRPVPCRQRLFTWQIEVAAALDSVGGRIYTKCRRCKEENEAVVSFVTGMAPVTV